MLITILFLKAKEVDYLCKKNRMNKAITSKVFMVRPVQFRYNEQTAKDNAFQIETSQSDEEKQSEAAQEFDGLVNELRSHGVDVLVIKDHSRSDTPDSVFPNNWISTHHTGEVIIYPMFAENRRKEVRQDIVDLLLEKYDYDEVLDWTTFTSVNQYLEGTGSLVLDRNSKIAYACISERTNLELAKNWCSVMDYELVSFSAVDKEGLPIYHTNVMMNIGEHVAVVCLDSIANEDERNKVEKYLRFSDKEIVEISFDQAEQFAGNMLQLATDKGKSLLVMSKAAFSSLTEVQKNQLSEYSELVVASIPTIEKNGGGSVRCMIAELF